MRSVVAISSIGLAMMEAVLTLKLSFLPEVSTEYAASIVGYNAIATVTLVSALTPFFRFMDYADSVRHFYTMCAWSFCNRCRWTNAAYRERVRGNRYQFNG